MSDFDEAGFQDFLRETEQGAEAQERIEYAQNRMRLFLVDRGVEFPSGEVTVSTMIHDKEILDRYVDDLYAAKVTELGRELEREEVVAFWENFNSILLTRQEIEQKRAMNDVMLLGLASLIATREVADSLGEPKTTEECTALKKRLQAEYLADGVDPEWIELIDYELPGDGLTDADGDLIADVAIAHTASLEKYRLTNEAKSEEMTAILTNAGQEDISTLERIAVVRLVGMYSVAALNPRTKESFAEEARVMLLGSNLLITDGWQRVINSLLDQIVPPAAE